MKNNLNIKRTFTLLLCIVLTSILTSSLAYADLNSSTGSVDNAPVSTATAPIITDSISDGLYVSKGTSINSPNSEKTAKIVRKNNSKYDSIIFYYKNENQVIDLENIIYTSIIGTQWLDDNRFAICGHINPSLNVYVIIDTNNKKIIGEYYGIGFTWNKNKDKLYYVETSPYFSDEKVNDKIVDNLGNIYYETEPSISMTDKFSISDDEQTFAFFVNDRISDTRKLIVATLNKNNKLEKKTEIDSPVGDILINNSKIKITDPNGISKDYNIQ